MIRTCCIGALTSVYSQPRALVPLAIFALLAAWPLAASAERVAGVSAGIGAWQQKADGDLESGIFSVDIEDDLGIDDDTDIMAYVLLEHSKPILPNVRLQYSDTALSGADVLTRSLVVNGVVFSFSNDVSTDIDLTQADAVFYYNVLDSAVSLDVGLAARYVDSRIRLISNSTISDSDFKGVLPLLYAGVRLDLPVQGLWVGAQAAGIGYQGDNLLDVQARLGYESRVGLGAELGWRSMRLESDEFDELDDTKLDISGPYLMLNYHF